MSLVWYPLWVTDNDTFQDLRRIKSTHTADIGQFMCSPHSLYLILSHHKFTVRCPGRRNNFVFPAMLPAPAFSKHSLQFSGYRSSLHLSIYPPPQSTSTATTAAPAFSSFCAETWGILDFREETSRKERDAALTEYASMGRRKAQYISSVSQLFFFTGQMVIRFIGYVRRNAPTLNSESYSG